MTSDAVEFKSTLETLRLLNRIRGSDYIQLMYTGGWRAFATAARLLRIPLAKSQPGLPQTNAIMERCNSTILRRTRVLLFQAGLPNWFWVYVALCWCMLHNITEGVKDKLWK